MKEVISNRILTSFVLDVFKYFHKLDGLRSFLPYFSISRPRKGKGVIVKLEKPGETDSLTGLFINTNKDDVLDRNKPHMRWFTDEFRIDDKVYYLSTQWNSSGNYQLTLKELDHYIRIAYGDKYSVKQDENRIFVFCINEDINDSLSYQFIKYKSFNTTERAKCYAQYIIEIEKKSNDDVVKYASIYPRHLETYIEQIAGCKTLFDFLNENECEKLRSIVKSDPNRSPNYDAAYLTVINKYKNMLNMLQNNECKWLEKESSKPIFMTSLPLQQIFYGAPGTGKSHKVDEMCKAYSNHRTTFHPDSDYSTFVGCYKPTKVKVDKKPLLNFNELADKLREYRTKDNETNAQVAFGYDYYQSLREVDNLGKLLLASGGAEYDTYLSAGMLIAKKEEGTKKAGDITYSFTPQAFTNAYVEAWQKFEKNEPVLLVIEEINRGNCAQIFGDLFQLLDRNEDGYSTYPIEPDTDLGTYISEQGLNVQNAILKKKDGTTEDISGDINQGKKLVLPPNLYIWATMNTSDQSLFPIDSAFKRRWDWKYVPIRDKKEENYKIETVSYLFDWWDFLTKVNLAIGEATSSEDKKLGYFFCKGDKKGRISTDKFVSKVLFYLWTDVFKDYEADEVKFTHEGKDYELLQYKTKEGEKESIHKFSFSDFFTEDGDGDPSMVEKFLINIDVLKEEKIKEG